jgi:hypothetical protein
VGQFAEGLRGGTIDNNPELIADLTGIEYGYVFCATVATQCSGSAKKI